MTIYDGYQHWNPGEYPAILAIGDSWFWYPRNNLLEALARNHKLRSDYRHMVCLGANGAVLSSYIDRPGHPGAHSARLKLLLGRDAMQYFSAFLVSGAGNDSVDYKLGLNKDCSGASTPEACISEGGLDKLFTRLKDHMSLLLADVLQAFEIQQRDPVVFLHGYDYCVPDGRRFVLKPPLVIEGPWLAPAMNACKVPDDAELRQEVVVLLIKRLAREFKQFARPGSGIRFIDSAGTLNSGPGYEADWDNELHPSRKGFDKIVDQHWMPALHAAGLATA